MHEEKKLKAPSLNDLQCLYYGLGDKAGGEINIDGGVAGDSMLPYEETKPEFFSAEKRVLWGCPSPINGDGTGNLDDLSSIGGSRNNVSFGPSWHSIVDSPLM